jgi:hypothetical protein
VAKNYTTNTLIESVKRREMLPETSATFKEVDFLAFANEEMDIGLMPLILSFHQDYLLQTVVVPLTEDTLRYKIPSRAMGNKIREVQYMDNNTFLYEMTRIFIEDLPYFQQGIGGPVRAFYMEGDEIVITALNRINNLQGSLRISYYMRCGELVSESRAALIKDINRTTGVVTLNRWPDAFTPIAGEPSAIFDFTPNSSPYKVSGFDIAPIALGDINNLTITFNTADIPTSLKVNDVVTLAEETIIPQVPVELHSILSQRVAIRCLQAMGDTTGVQMAMAKLQEMETKTGNVIDNRAEGSPLKVSPKHTFLKRSRFYLRR